MADFPPVEIRLVHFDGESQMKLDLESTIGL
jgi:hypothetical protein